MGRRIKLAIRDDRAMGSPAQATEQSGPASGPSEAGSCTMRQHMEAPGMSKLPTCSSCMGSGEMATDYGCVDCPDCGGAGFHPSRHVLVDWRARDIERSLPGRDLAEAADLAWAIAEMRRARAALVEIIALAHDAPDDDAIGGRLRFVANRALGFYDHGAEVEGASADVAR